MEDMIKKIVDMDKRASKLTDEAKSRRKRSAEYIATKKEAVHKEYEDMARHRIEVIRAEEMEHAEKRARIAALRQSENEKLLKRALAENKQSWVEQIVARTISIDS